MDMIVYAPEKIVCVESPKSTCQGKTTIDSTKGTVKSSVCQCCVSGAQTSAIVSSFRWKNLSLVSPCWRGRLGVSSAAVPIQVGTLRGRGNGR